MPRIRPSRGTHVTLPRELLDVRGRRDRAGRRRAHRVRAALARAARWWARPTTTTRARVEHVPPADEDIAYLLEAVNAFFGTDLGPAT